MDSNRDLKIHAEAMYACAAKDYKTALTCFQKMSAITSTIFFNIGSCHLLLNETEKALQSLRECVSCDENMTIGSFQCGIAEFLRGDYRAADEHFKRAVTLPLVQSSYGYREKKMPYKIRRSEIAYNHALVLVILDGNCGMAKSCVATIRDAAANLSRRDFMDEGVHALLSDDVEFFTVNPVDRLLRLPDNAFFWPEGLVEGYEAAKSVLPTAKVVALKSRHDSCSTYGGADVVTKHYCEQEFDREIFPLPDSVLPRLNSPSNNQPKDPSQSPRKDSIPQRTDDSKQAVHESPKRGGRFGYVVFHPTKAPQKSIHSADVSFRKRILPTLGDSPKSHGTMKCVDSSKKTTTQFRGIGPLYSRKANAPMPHNEGAESTSTPTTTYVGLSSAAPSCTPKATFGIPNQRDQGDIERNHHKHDGESSSESDDDSMAGLSHTIGDSPKSQGTAVRSSSIEPSRTRITTFGMPKHHRHVDKQEYHQKHDVGPSTSNKSGGYATARSPKRRSRSRYRHPRRKQDSRQAGYSTSRTSDICDMSGLPARDRTYYRPTRRRYKTMDAILPEVCKEVQCKMIIEEKSDKPTCGSDTSSVLIDVHFDIKVELPSKASTREFMLQLKKQLWEKSKDITEKMDKQQLTVTVESKSKVVLDS